jgi:predicted GH43/DUF377 family glycosyl hydrolase
MGQLPIHRRSDRRFIQPQFPYEIEGRNASTFTEGAARYKGEWCFFYGAADRAIGMAKVRESHKDDADDLHFGNV